jgi:hypothetical protein
MARIHTIPNKSTELMAVSAIEPVGVEVNKSGRLKVLIPTNEPSSWEPLQLILHVLIDRSDRTIVRIVEIEWLGYTKFC